MQRRHSTLLDPFGAYPVVAGSVLALGVLQFAFARASHRMGGPEAEGETTVSKTVFM